MATPEPFPQLSLNYEGPDANPGIQLFGRRFFTDQSVMEYLSEFLLVVNSPKRISDEGEGFDSLLPSWEQLQEWPSGAALGYRAPVRLALKLFAFLGASKLDTRHESHKQQYTVIIDKLKEAIHTDGTIDKQDILHSLENLFLGFQGVGINRTWCAQVFMPVALSLLACETNWQQTKTERGDVTSWREAIPYFSSTQKLFMARGGELLYLHLCNAFRADRNELHDFVSHLDLVEEEQNPQQLHASLQRNLKNITGQCPEALNSVAELIDNIDNLTAEQTNCGEEYMQCAWCPRESWREGYLFAVELNRLCQATIDPIERIDLLMMGCAFQVLRTLCAQSVRYAGLTDELRACGGELV